MSKLVSVHVANKWVVQDANAEQKETKRFFAWSKSELPSLIPNMNSFFLGGASMKEDNKTIGEVGQHKLMHNWAKTETILLADYDI